MSADDDMHRMREAQKLKRDFTPSRNEEVERERMIATRLGKCKHFTGLFGPGMKKHDTCDAGVEYSTVHVAHDPIEYTSRGRTYSSDRSLPCVDSLNHCGVTCAKRKVVSRAEAEVDVERVEAELRQLTTAFQRISAQNGNVGTVECPKCGGNLHWSRAATNGHVWGRCETNACLSWMQ